MAEIKQKDRDIKNHIEEVIKKGKKYTTKELSKELAKHFGDNDEVDGFQYVKQRLHTHREWLPEQVQKLETFKEDDETGGEDTRYWRLKK